MFDPDAEAWLVIDGIGRRFVCLEYEAAMRHATRYGGVPQPLVLKGNNAHSPTAAGGESLHNQGG